jgi:hypothetical protein
LDQRCTHVLEFISIGREEESDFVANVLDVEPLTDLGGIESLCLAANR